MNSVPTTNTLPTGSTYLEGLNDGREVWFDGERVKNVATHPAFRNSARTIAQLYDALHDPAQEDTLLTTDHLGDPHSSLLLPQPQCEGFAKSP